MTVDMRKSDVTFFPPADFFFFKSQKSPYVTHNLHINVILYCHWLTLLHHLRSIWRHLVRTQTNCTECGPQTHWTYRERAFKETDAEKPDCKTCTGTSRSQMEELFNVLQMQHSCWAHCALCIMRSLPHLCGECRLKHLHNPVKIYPSHM